jgi:hypothetical protein
MDPQQIERARQGKRLFLWSVLTTLIVGLVSLVSARIPGMSGAALVLRICNMIFVGVATWRFCRSIGIGTAYSVVNVLLSPFVLIIQLVVLLRIYAKRTGVRLTFLMGDRLPSAS